MAVKWYHCSNCCCATVCNCQVLSSVSAVELALSVAARWYYSCVCGFYNYCLCLCYDCLCLSGRTGFIYAVVRSLFMAVRWYYCCICGRTFTVCNCQVLCSVFVVMFCAVRVCQMVLLLYLWLYYYCLWLLGVIILCVCGCAISVCVCQVLLVWHMLLYYCYLWLSDGITVVSVFVLLLSVAFRCYVFYHYYYYYYYYYYDKATDKYSVCL